VKEETAKLVISGLPLGNLGVGQGVYTYRIIVGLLRRAPELRFRVLVPAHYSLPPEIPEGIIDRIPGRQGFRPLLEGIYWSNRILSFARDLPATTVFHSPGPIFGFGRPPKTVVTIHDCIYRTFPRYFGRSGIRRLNILATERYAARSTLVLTQSDFSRRAIAEQTAIPTEKIRVLSPWVDESFMRAASSAALIHFRAKLELPERYWLYVGGYDYRKNVEFLIQSYARARRQQPLPPLVLAGIIPKKADPVSCDVLGALRQASLRSTDVLMPGFISSGDLPDLYRAASLLIYPSLMEGFGIPPAEAMAVGTPLLASNTSSLPEVVQKAECLFDPTNQVDLTDKLVAAAQDETQFSAQLCNTFTELHGINRYLQLINKVSPSGNSQ
jgi:glycosyltransferase involved in cell wall biosynthesis